MIRGRPINRVDSWPKKKKKKRKKSKTKIRIPTQPKPVILLVLGRGSPRSNRSTGPASADTGQLRRGNQWRTTGRLVLVKLRGQGGAVTMLARFDHRSLFQLGLSDQKLVRTEREKKWGS